MYKIYLKRFNGSGQPMVDASTRTTTPSPAAAKAAFLELISDTSLLGSKSHAVLSLNNKQLMYHRFDLTPEHADFVSPDDEIRLFHD